MQAETGRRDLDLGEVFRRCPRQSLDEVEGTVMMIPVLKRIEIFRVLLVYRTLRT